MTAYGKDEDKAQSEKAGFVLHLLKPVSPGTLLRVLVTASNAGGTVGSTSAATALVAGAVASSPTPPPPGNQTMSFSGSLNSLHL